MSRLTLLIAVYNAEQTLRRCLDSLLRQTFTDWQAVCVDDCSQDRSLEILHAYARHDKRFQVLHLDRNQGLAHARNEGFRLAEGELVTFLDSDDWLADDALECAVKTFEAHPQTDCVLFRFVFQSAEGEHCFPMDDFEVLQGQQAFMLSLDNWKIHGVYVARRALYERYLYDETCRVYSDELTTHLHYFISREVRQCGGTYYYWQNPQSVTRKPSVRRFDQLRAKERMREHLIRLQVAPNLLGHYETLRWIALVDCYMFYHVHGHELTSAERREGLSVLRHAWQTIDRNAADRRLLRNFGYRPMPTWALFRCQEWIYFTLRGVLGKNR